MSSVHPARLAFERRGWTRATSRIIVCCHSRRTATLALPVFGLAVLEIWAAVPAGIALGMPPLVVWLLTVSGSVLGVAVVGFGGGALRGWLARRRGDAILSRSPRLHGVWLRYGVPGWGLVSPLVMAPAMGTAVGLLLGAPKRRLMLWMTAGVVLWTSSLVIAGTVGLNVIHAFAGSWPR